MTGLETGSGYPVAGNGQFGAAAPPLPIDRPEDVEDIYRAHYKLLLYVACKKFRVPESDAESLVQDVFLSYLSAAPSVRDVKAWLVAAACNASRHYWRTQGRTEPLPDDVAERSDPSSQALADSFAMRLTIQQTLGYLQEKCRETLRLHYFEGYSAAETAKHLSTTPRYAEKLIHNCLKRAHEVYTTLMTLKS